MRAIINATDIISVRPRVMSQCHLREQVDPESNDRVERLTHPLTRVVLTSPVAAI
jgi:hypothetical protein